MTSRERFERMFEHREADRIPINPNPWGSTIERWQKEGLPEGVSCDEYFDLDKVAGIRPDNSPQFPKKVIEETDDYIIEKTVWGATMKNWKHAGSTPDFLEFTVTDPDGWEEAKKRMVPSRDRIDWDILRDNYSRWRKEGYWVQAVGWFGFDITHSYFIGTERMLIALVENPEWCKDMFETELEVHLQLLDMILDEGYEFDALWWPDDMGYKHNQFFSLDMYRDLLKPIHKKAIEWAHSRGLKAHLHSCGDVNPFVPELVEMGLDALHPLEVKAGMDPVSIKKEYGDKLVLNGGINAVLWDKPEKITEEIKRLIPILKENGGYIFSSDHSVPSSVSLEQFREIIDLVKEIGSY
jgi:uroporphyrinogen decarboxylase